MKMIAALSRIFPSFDHKDHEIHRSWSGFNSIATSRSSKSSRSTYRNEQPQIIYGSWIDGAKLRELLNRKFGSEYKLEMRSDDYRLYARGRLTDEEIMCCAA
ncbi:hypothetical protein HD806DRAFT_485729 [Xylariaceae sp. AK1471]|nr:hypothetical protein HD806DRAFT_485729 [Xylariaceae sp. AK1471]